MFDIVLHKTNASTHKRDLNNDRFVDIWPDGMVPYEIDEMFFKESPTPFDRLIFQIKRWMRSLLDIKFDLEYQYGILNIFKSAFKQFHKFTSFSFQALMKRMTLNDLTNKSLHLEIKDLVNMTKMNYVYKCNDKSS